MHWLWLAILCSVTGCATQYTHAEKSGTAFGQDVQQCRMAVTYEVLAHGPEGRERFSYYVVNPEMLDRCLVSRGWQSR